jgi:2,3-bisphosphoglycerate-independent phosphoglycerate mutase
MEKLEKSAKFAGSQGPVVLAIMDGVGIGKYDEGDMVRKASTPNLDWLKKHALCSQLKAHGTAVGLPSDDDMGNSEVGHNAIGCGRILDQGARRVEKAIADGSIFEGETWKDLISKVASSGGKLHFIGLFSDGNVHSNIKHLKSMLERAASEGVKTARVHALLDGRDVPPTSALDYIDPFEDYLADLNSAQGVDYRIASGGGRMYITMDRYNADWEMVARGWKAHVKGEGRQFDSAHEAIETYRAENEGILDQDMHEFVIVEGGEPVGRIEDGDSVIFFNYRGDRAIEITRAFEEPDLDAFERGAIPDVTYAGMMQYDGDLMLPKKYLVAPPAIDRTMGEYLAKTGVKQFAISETQKFGHVTYFFNGNRSGKFSDELESYVEIPSDMVPFEQRPWMKAAEISDRVIAEIEKGEYRFIRLNFPNGDMVGHTGVPQAAEIAVECVDLCIGRLIKAVQKARGILIVSADHGNSDDMYAHDKSGAVKTDEQGRPESKTAHSLNPVPVFVYDPAGTANFKLSEESGLGISSLAATSIVALGYVPPADYTPSVVNVAD